MNNTQQAPKISIIVPVYNVAPYLRESLASLQQQTLQQLEIICVDDGSTDDSLAILHSIAAEDDRVRVLTQPNQRQGAARNKGVDAAKGEFILYFDSDDLLTQTSCERLYEAAERTQSDIACMSILRIKGEKTRWLVHFTQEQTYETLQSKFDAANIPRQFSTVNMLYRRSWLLESGIRFEERVQYEDVMYSSQVVAAARRLVTVPEATYHYIRRFGSTMASRQSKKQQLDRYNAAKQFVAFADRIGLKINPKQRTFVYRVWKLGRINLLKITECDGIQTYRLMGILPIYKRTVTA